MNKNLFKSEDLLKKEDNKCKCAELAIEPHTCPYSEEINGDSTTLCNCCDECSYQCAMDI